MKCLSLWQPWASLMVLGAKKIETRDWFTSYRGPLLIHAAKRDSELYFTEFPDFAAALEPLKGRMPLGMLLGTVDLVDCRPTESFTDFELDTVHGSGHKVWTERSFGNYGNGRFGWVTANPKMFDEPVLYKGQQGLFDVNDLDEVVAAIAAEKASRIRVFDTGTQFADWEMRNCDQCWKSFANQPRQRKDGKSKCELDYELTAACMGDGRISPQVGERIGYKPGAQIYTWDCPERETERPPRQRATKPKPAPSGQLQLLEAP